jgi:8-oxo-dGTP pyrophosphatase MutT (NUDIX family)
MAAGRLWMPATPDPAATVMLLRDGAGSPEVLLIERHAQSEFLPDMYVFPGGRVEEQDRLLADRVGGLVPERAAARLGMEDPALAVAFFVAAVRETFEECGILLARPLGSAEFVDAERTAEIARHRLAVQDGKASFRELIESEKLELAADLLSVHAHWITPEMVPRRFDTYFFAALTPPGQQALHDGVETTAHVWIRPEDALAEMRAGERQIIFPTACNLETLVGFAGARQAFEASQRRRVVTVLPVMQERGGRRVLVIPAEAGYPTSEQAIEATRTP